MMKRYKQLRKAILNMGTVNVLSYLWKARILNKLYIHPEVVDTYRLGILRTKQLAHPVLCRYGSSDFKVFRQIFVTDSYAALPLSERTNLIIDCGAYVGYSTAYFLERCPNADILAIEPDNRNFAVLERNVKAYGRRVSLFHSAVWSHEAKLRVIRGDSGEWATQVEECNNGQSGDLEALDIPSILGDRRARRIDVMKVDIEGAEGVLFSRNYEGWIDQVDAFAIELHGDHNKEVFLRALSGRGFEFRKSGEVMIARRIVQKAREGGHGVNCK